MKKVALGLMIVAALALMAPSSWAAPPAYHWIHIVRWGENLYRIALHYGTTVHAIASANGIVNPNRIYAGQRLVIPGGTWPGPGGFWYTVHYGDTLSGLAWRFGRNMWTIANANGITNPNWIYAGQRLYIP